MIPILDREISFYQSITSVGFKNISIKNALDAIKSGQYKTTITAIRNYLLIGKTDDARAAKINLPAFTFCGTFKGNRQAKNIDAYSGLIIFDIDKLESVVLAKLIADLQSDPIIFSYWLSPSGSGLKILIAADCVQTNYKYYFQGLKNYFEKTYNISIDSSGSDLSRLCFVSYDDNLFLNIQAQTVDVIFIEQHFITSEEKTITSRVLVNIPATGDNRSLNYNKGKNKSENRDNIDKVIKYLIKYDKSITSSYDDWFRVACAIANTFTFDIGKKYYLKLCSLDKAKYNPIESENMLIQCYQKRIEGAVSFSTIVYLAKQQGFDMDKANLKFT